MRAFSLENGSLLVPRRAAGPDGMIGDGMVEVSPGSPEYLKWLPYAEPLPPHMARRRGTHSSFTPNSSQ